MQSELETLRLTLLEQEKSVEAMQLEQTADAEMVKRRDAAQVSLTSVQAAADARAAYIPLGPAAASLRYEG